MAALTQGTWNFDPAHSEIGLTVRHAGISKTRAVFEEAQAVLQVAENGTATVEAQVQASSFSSGNEDRDGHVRGEDFLDAAQHPTLTFRAEGVAVSDEEFEMPGELTIRGVTHPVTFEAEFGGQAVDPFGATRAGFSATTTISRKEFGLTWNAALEAGGVLVGDKVKIELEVAFVLDQGE
ncbi:YceI family protein [Nesterenkonia aerolata]|uniref:YceI family protein n=1 Tax=Nesterenkonia aerolata TaxID=3074079 RepID=A0ABU2DUB2_9MICC|nr:YceI family protein [Nesterenkonia sp. LY-0111]MDR8020098.1 YceI family protein [Nesterenkonia sp. LY-0111]